MSITPASSRHATPARLVSKNARPPREDRARARRSGRRSSRRVERESERRCERRLSRRRFGQRRPAGREGGTESTGAPARLTWSSLLAAEHLLLLAHGHLSGTAAVHVSARQERLVKRLRAAEGPGYGWVRGRTSPFGRRALLAAEPGAPPRRRKRAWQRPPRSFVLHREEVCKAGLREHRNHVNSQAVAHHGRQRPPVSGNPQRPGRNVWHTARIRPPLSLSSCRSGD